ncbi:MAG: hypothetical protein ACJ8CS_18300, partial [Microvirga sp.]
RAPQGSRRSAEATISKRTYTVEVTYMLPVYKHVQVEASSAAHACELALEHDDWDVTEQDYDSSGPSHVTGIWAGGKAYHGRCFRVPLEFQDKPTNALILVEEIVESDLVRNDLIGRCKTILGARQDH